MSSLDDLDAEKSGPFALALPGGERAVLRSPQDMTWREVAGCIADLAAFVRLAGVPGMPANAIAAVRGRWITHHGLTADNDQTRRLAHVMDRYANQLEADFPRCYPGVGPADLWRARKWRCLLNLIDHLPQNTYYQHALAQDPEHAKRVAAWKADPRNKDKIKTAPPWSIWSPELAKLTDILDQLKVVAYRVGAVNGNKPEKPKFDERPKSEIEKAEREIKWQNHNKLADKFLPHRRNRD